MLNVSKGSDNQGHGTFRIKDVTVALFEDLIMTCAEI